MKVKTIHFGELSAIYWRDAEGRSEAKRRGQVARGEASASVELQQPDLPLLLPTNDGRKRRWQP